MTEQRPRQDQDKVIIRMPDGMRDDIQAEAKRNNRSANAEIVARLAQSGIGGGETLRDKFAMAAPPVPLDYRYQPIPVRPEIVGNDEAGEDLEWRLARDQWAIENAIAWRFHWADMVLEYRRKAGV